MKFFLLILKNLRRNKLRTFLTCLATMVLVFVVTMIWTVVYFIENFTKEKSGNLKAIATVRYDMAGRMPLSYAGPLSHGGATKPGDKEPVDSMAWQFYIGTMGSGKTERENMIPLLACDAAKLPWKEKKNGKTILHKGFFDDLDPMEPDLIQALRDKKDGCIIGRKRLKMLNKRVGERFKVTGAQFTGIDLEFEIVGVLPAGRWDEAGVMNAQYLNDAVDAYQGPSKAKHPLDQQRIDMFWMEVGNKDDFGQVVEQVNNSPSFQAPALKCETFASLIANFLDSWSGFIFFIEWVLVPGSMFSMVLLVANAISLNVRERIKEFAILKVLGFSPGSLLILVLGEALLLGATSGLVAGGLIFWIANTFVGGITVGGSEPFPVPWQAVFWGGGVGAATALIGSILPAMTARAVRASQVFARVA
ncbi:MAG TPA: ABC transporter permease [Gemmataceae bacterium]|nr:ABC transporter permease [Gemmataceae bacterium]